MLAAYHLRRKGVPALYLGPDTPLPDLRALARRLGAGAVVLSALLSEPLKALPDGALKDLAPRVFLGGQGAGPEEARRLGAEYMEDLKGLAEALWLPRRPEKEAI